jgi:hypothetical protein
MGDYLRLWVGVTEIMGSLRVEGGSKRSDVTMEEWSERHSVAGFGGQEGANKPGVLGSF